MNIKHYWLAVFVGLQMLSHLHGDGTTTTPSKKKAVASSLNSNTHDSKGRSTEDEAKKKDVTSKSTKTKKKASSASNGVSKKGSKNSAEAQASIENSDDDLEMLPLARDEYVPAVDLLVIDPANPVDVATATSDVELASATSAMSDLMANPRLALANGWNGLCSLMRLIITPQFYIDTFHFILDEIKLWLSPRYYMRAFGSLYATCRNYFKSFLVITPLSIGYSVYVIRRAAHEPVDKRQICWEIWESSNQTFDYLVEFARLTTAAVIPDVISNFLDSLSSLGSFFNPAAEKK